MVSMFGVTHVASSASVHGSNVLFPFWVFAGPMLLIGAFVYWIVRSIRERQFRAYMAHYPYPPQV
jgi:hypothetical protein